MPLMMPPAHGAGVVIELHLEVIGHDARAVAGAWRDDRSPAGKAGAATPAEQPGAQQAQRRGYGGHAAHHKQGGGRQGQGPAGKAELARHDGGIGAREALHDQQRQHENRKTQ